MAKNLKSSLKSLLLLHHLRHLALRKHLVSSLFSFTSARRLILHLLLLLLTRCRDTIVMERDPVRSFPRERLLADQCVVPLTDSPRLEPCVVRCDQIQPQLRPTVLDPDLVEPFQSARDRSTGLIFCGAKAVLLPSA